MKDSNNNNIDIDELIKNLPEVKERKSMLPALVISLIIITIILIIIVNVLPKPKKVNSYNNYKEVI